MNVAPEACAHQFQPTVVDLSGELDQGLLAGGGIVDATSVTLIMRGVEAVTGGWVFLAIHGARSALVADQLQPPGRPFRRPARYHRRCQGRLEFSTAFGSATPEHIRPLARIRCAIQLPR